MFNWKFSAENHVGAPEERLLVFKVDGEMFPGGGIVKKVSEGEVAKSGASKVFFYVDSIENAIEVSLVHLFMPCFCLANTEKLEN